MTDMRDILSKRKYGGGEYIQLTGCIKEDVDKTLQEIKSKIEGMKHPVDEMKEATVKAVERGWNLAITDIASMFK